MPSDFTGYLDASGTDAGQKVVAFAGFISTPREWQKFAREWAGVLAEFAVPYFHMTEFFNAKGLFWGWPEERQADLIWKLGRIIGRRTMLAFGAAIMMDDYEDALGRPESYDVATDLGERERILADPYTLCLDGCVQCALKWLAADLPNEDRLALVLDQDDPRRMRNASSAYESIRRRPDEAEKRFSRLGALTFADKRTALPLQAADLIAHQSFQHLRDRLPEAGEIRDVLRWIFEDVAHDIWYFDRVSFEKLAVFDELRAMRARRSRAG